MGTGAALVPAGANALEVGGTEGESCRMRTERVGVDRGWWATDCHFVSAP